MDFRDVMLWIVLISFFGFVVYLLCGFARILDDREAEQEEYEEDSL